MINQKEGNGNLHTIFAHSEQVCEFTSEIFHHLINWADRDGLSPEGDDSRKQRVKLVIGCTYTKNSGVIRDPRWLWGRSLTLLLSSDADVLHIASPENDVLVDTGRGGNLVGRVSPSTFGTKGHHILKGYCGGLGVDFVQGADITGIN